MKQEERSHNPSLIPWQDIPLSRHAKLLPLILHCGGAAPRVAQISSARRARAHFRIVLELLPAEKRAQQLRHF